jgi:hypothetical protein
MTVFTTAGKGLVLTANSNVLSIRSTATKKARILEITAYCETATAFLNPALFLTTVVDASGTAVAGQPDDGTTTSNDCTVQTAPTGGTLRSTPHKRASAPATAGAGFQWIWPDYRPLIVPVGLSAILRNDGAATPTITWMITWDE